MFNLTISVRFLNARRCKPNFQNAYLNFKKNKFNHSHISILMQQSLKLIKYQVKKDPSNF